ncbi:hypothetical protein FRC05_003291 [Tulasnella sp. 425]|nr:hypothetical protein FRC05_003291 [Tulasnella sp. 425]
MHPIWNIPELLAQILLFLDEKSDILRCALVCRSLSVEAARLIWKEVSAFRHLLGCFPYNTIATEMAGPNDSPSRTFLFLELPDTAEWDHMRFRASMVKELTLPSSDNYDALLEVIKRHKIDLTFPELVSLHLHVLVPKRLQTFLPLFASSKLQDLEITFEGYNERLINSALAILLVQAHQLRSLEVVATSLPETSQNHLSQIIETTPTINYLRLGLKTSHGENIVVAASRLPNLQDLSLEFMDYSGIRTEYTSGFPSLLSLETWSTFASTLAVVRAISSPKMAVFRLHIIDEIVVPPRGLCESMATMSNLKSVSFIFHRSRRPQWEDMEPLLACPLISTFLVTVSSPGFEIDDEVISAISRAWPNLTRLWLDGLEPTPKRFRRPTLRGLAGLLCGCPKLQEVILEVDARARQLRGTPVNTASATPGPHGKLSLNVRRSRIAEKSEVSISEYLMSVWPGECEVTSYWEESEWQGATWTRVGELVKQRGPSS